MSEAVAITIDLSKELLEDVKLFAAEAKVPWEASVAALIEAGLILAEKGRALEAYDFKRCFTWLPSGKTAEG